MQLRNIGLIIIALVSIVACQQGQQETNQSDLNGDVIKSKAENNETYKKNLLEDAIDPFTGNREKWNEFIDNGSLNSVSDFYGISVESINVQWKASKELDFALLVVSKAVAPKKIRAALNQACQTKEENWKKESGHLLSGSVSNNHITCRYITNESSPTTEVSISVEDEADGLEAAAAAGHIEVAPN